jgi:hypothetical protein
MQKREKKGGEEIKWGTLYKYMEMSQQKSLYNYYILRKAFKKQ